VFRVDSSQAAKLFAAIKSAAATAPIVSLRSRGRHGVVCGVDVTIRINSRAAQVRTSWHYADEDFAPRLVTAFPTT
jgi:hypothetical protein